MKGSRWFGIAANVASVLSFVGAVPSWWLKQPIFTALAIGLGAGILSGRVSARLERGTAKISPPAPEKGEVDPRATVLESARGLTHTLTSEPWPEFPGWQWTLDLSKHAFATVMDRVQERAVAGMKQAELEKLVTESVRMYITEGLQRRAGRQQSYAVEQLRRRNSWMGRLGQW